MALPAEVRHRIYRHLLRPSTQPIWLNKHVPIQALLGPDAPYEPDPVFQTQVFRLNKQIHDDSIMFAYGVNEFQVRERFEVFCGLSRNTAASIRSLKIVPSMWRGESAKEQEMWEKLKECTNLERLEVYFHADILLPAARHLNELRQQIQDQRVEPLIVLDLCEWERHMTFDFDRDEYDRACRSLREGGATDSAVDPKQRIVRLPLHARQISLAADVSSAALRAFQEYLDTAGSPPLVRSVKELPQGGTRSIGGRAQRYWFELQLS